MFWSGCLLRQNAVMRLVFWYQQCIKPACWMWVHELFSWCSWIVQDAQQLSSKTARVFLQDRCPTYKSAVLWKAAVNICFLNSLGIGPTLFWMWNNVGILRLIIRPKMCEFILNTPSLPFYPSTLSVSNCCRACSRGLLVTACRVFSHLYLSNTVSEDEFKSFT